MLSERHKSKLAVSVGEVFQKSVATAIAVFQKTERKNKTFVFAIARGGAVNHVGVYKNDITFACGKAFVIKCNKKTSFYYPYNFKACVPVESHFVLRVVLIDDVNSERKIFCAVLFEFVKAHNVPFLQKTENNYVFYYYSTSN